MGIVVSAATDEILYQSGVVSRPTVVGQVGIIEDYELLEEIGSGGMGIVFRARKVLNPKAGEVALKTVHPRVAQARPIARRFNREILAIQRLAHPYIVEILDVSNRPEGPYYVMPFYRHGSIVRLLRDRGKLEQEDVLRFGMQIATALCHAHEADIKHGDVKPSNLLLDDDERTVRLSDFGLARDFASNAEVGDPRRRLRVGTAPYMSPRMVEGKGEGLLADVYMFGATLYELLAGHAPYKSGRADDDQRTLHILEQITNGPPPPLRPLCPNVAALLLEIVEKAMARDPEDRYTTFEAVLSDFNELSRQFSSSCVSCTGPSASDKNSLGGRIWNRNAPPGEDAVSSRADQRDYLPTRTQHPGARLAVVFGLVLAAGGVWLATGSFQALPIAAVKVDEMRPTVILAWRGKAREPELFHAFPEHAGRVGAVARLNLAVNGPQAIVAGLRSPLGGDCLFMFNVEGDITARWNLSSDRSWPDCGPPTQWHVTALAVGNLDGLPGDEVAVAASDELEYPTQICVIDPLTQSVRSFWHLGQITALSVQPDFFGPGKPALLAFGENNKIDGFNGPGLHHPPRPYITRAGEDRPTTQYGRVRIVMILDPADMIGVGPPRTPHTSDLAGAIPFAYAFLDLPCSSADYMPDGGTQAITPSHGEITGISRVMRVARVEEDDTSPWFEIHMERAFVDSPELRTPAILKVDRNLTLRTIVIPDSAAAYTTEEYWRSRWKPIIQDRVYLSD